jgi:metallo-beta-lactamase family protein
MKIAFHGAARTVTGSKHLITLNNGKQILLDCGMFQGMGKDTDAMNEDFGFDASAVTHMVLSHAHIDHTGLIPLLVKRGFSGSIYCTPATRDLTEILLLDSARIQQDDVKYINKKRKKRNEPPVDPLYTIADAERSVAALKPVNYKTWFKIDENVDVLFTDAGHIIGSAAVHLRITEDGKTSQISFSGDIGRYNDAILRAPDVFPQADYILMESTYGSTLHAEAEPSDDKLVQFIKHTCKEKKGKLIIPAFSVGRTQELLYALNRAQLQGKLPDVDIFVDSPLSMEATEVVRSHPETFNNDVNEILKVDDDPFDFPGLHYIKTVDESKQLNFRTAPCVIISASGMAEAGRVKHHIANNIGNANNTILLVGYCEPRSLGGKLMNGAKRVSIYGNLYDVMAEVGSIRSMSAHGDYEDLAQWLACQDVQKVKKLFLVHGEYDVQQILRTYLQNKHFKTIEIPERHSVTELS